MNKRITIIILVFVLIVLVFGADKFLKLYSNKGFTSDEMSGESNISSTSKEIQKEKPEIKEITLENFTSEVLESEKTVLINLYATWCEACQMVSTTLEEIAKERDDVKVVKIDVDSEIELAMQYNAYSIPVLVVVSSGEEVNRCVGVASKSQIEEML